MNRRASLIFLVFLTVILSVGFPSCDGPDYAAIRDIDRIDIFDLESRQYLGDPAVTPSDSISLLIDLEIKLFSFQYLPGTMAEAWAFHHHDALLANEITDIRIYCDKPIYDTPAGENLAGELQFGDHGLKVSLHQYLELLPSKGEYFTYFSFPIQVFFNTKPIPGTYTFRVEIVDNNGHVLTGTAPSLEWL